jgi:hypothetical protein
MAGEDLRIGINGDIFLLIQILGDEIHRDVENPVDNLVDRSHKYPIATIFYHIA